MLDSSNCGETHSLDLIVYNADLIVFVPIGIVLIQWFFNKIEFLRTARIHHTIQTVMFNT